MISIVLTVHNQEDLLPSVLEGIDRCSSLTKEVVLVFDGCTDRSKEKFYEWYKPHKFYHTVIIADNIFETKANNLGLRYVTQPYAVIVQDDCAIKQNSWDKALLEPMLKWDNIFAVSGRNSHNIKLHNDIVDYYDVAGSGTNLNNPNKFYIRAVVNRGPLLLRMNVAKELNYFDEVFCPQNGDDHDLCLRAYNLGYICGCRPIDFRSDYSWGGTRKGNGKWIADAINKNMKILRQRHLDFISKDYPNEERDL